MIGRTGAEPAGLLAEQNRWLAQCRSDADQLPLRPRVPLLWQSEIIGSVEPVLVDTLLGGAGGKTLPLREQARDGSRGYEVQGPLSAGLARIADALRDRGLAHVWRNERLPVRSASGSLLGEVERAVVRPLGIPTRAVHLVGRAADGRHWVQQRSLTKANDPGCWDTLVGGMVPVGESVADALARETWEEAGLRLPQVQALAVGGCVRLRRPATGERAAGYVVEQIDWYRAVLPEGVVPVNQDGEVAQFRLLATEELRRSLLCNDFTLEAALILAEALGWGQEQPS